MNRSLTLLIAGIAAISCHKPGPDFKFGKLDTNLLNKVIGKSELIDRTVLRPDHIRLFLDRSTGIKTFVTKNDSGWIEAIEQMRNGISLFESQYYSNGQQTGDCPREKDGMLTGPAVYYYRDGKISCTGTWEKWGQVGEWKYYDENGKLTKTEMKGQPDK